ncbi:uncharacterized protein LOC128723127 [Anopheles nili]|uniref:uncharacterized protein LOC128723127 n=1 Tax=Anopheles nili TaxID=185578 RepID=UPI00237B1515|nr:uncharacterized protein LOC128723127 [Anopheles nili]
MNFRVSELTEIALQILGYKLYDRNGTQTESLENVIEKYQFSSEKVEPTTAQKGQKRKQSSVSSAVGQKQFMAQFDLPDFDTILIDTNKYVEGQMTSFIKQLQSSLVSVCRDTDYRNHRKGIRIQNAVCIGKELPVFCSTVSKTYNTMKYVDEQDIISRSNDEDFDKEEYILVKQGLLLREFNTLLQLLKHILDTTPKTIKELDATWLLMLKSYEAILGRKTRM